MAFISTNLIHQFKNKVFKVYLNSKGEEGIFITTRGRRFFLKLKKITFKVNPERLSYWEGRVEKAGGFSNVIQSKNVPTLDPKSGRMVHVLFDELYRTWPSEEDKKWFRNLSLNWYRNRNQARKELRRLMLGRKKNPLWDEIYTLNQAILEAESKGRGSLELYRGFSFPDLGRAQALFDQVTEHEVLLTDDPRKILRFFKTQRNLSAPLILKDYPFSSFSADYSEASMFGVVDSAEIPIRRIVGHYRTCLGSYAESEYAVHAPLRRTVNLHTQGIKVREFKEYSVWPNLTDKTSRRSSIWEVFTPKTNLITTIKGAKTSSAHIDTIVRFTLDDHTMFNFTLTYNVKPPRGKDYIYKWHIHSLNPYSLRNLFSRSRDLTESSLNELLQEQGYAPYLFLNYDLWEFRYRKYYFAPVDYLKPIQER